MRGLDCGLRTAVRGERSECGEGAGGAGGTMHSERRVPTQWVSSGQRRSGQRRRMRATHRPVPTHRARCAWDGDRRKRARVKRTYAANKHSEHDRGALAARSGRPERGCVAISEAKNRVHDHRRTAHEQKPHNTHSDPKKRQMTC